jgi:hypothetical protein
MVGIKADSDGHGLCCLDRYWCCRHLVGILFYGEPSTVMRLGSASLIVLGIIGLKLAHG